LSLFWCAFCFGARSSKLIEARQSLSIGDSRLANNRFLLASAFLTLDSLHFVFARLLLPHISPGVSAMYVLAG
jgi:hypothetical protein